MEGIELLDGFTKVSGPLIAIALTVCTVFLPSAFTSGIPGLFAQLEPRERGFALMLPTQPALRATLSSKEKEQVLYVLDLARMPGIVC